MRTVRKFGAGKLMRYQALQKDIRALGWHPCIWLASILRRTILRISQKWDGGFAN